MHRILFQFELVFILMLVGTVCGNDQNVSISANSNTQSVCSDAELDDCWKKLASASNHGIPSSHQKIESTCRVFYSGMECVNNWASTCLSKEGQEKIENSLSGAIQMYKHLCTETIFRENYLKHANCYQRISPHWDYCNTKFSDTLRKIDYARDTLSLCCIRIHYNNCLNNVTELLCSDVATDFLQSITETLMQSPMQEHHSSKCINVDQRNCTISSSAKSSHKLLNVSPIPFQNGMLSSLKILMLAAPSLFLGHSFLVLQLYF